MRVKRAKIWIALAALLVAGGTVAVAASSGQEVEPLAPICAAPPEFALLPASEQVVIISGRDAWLGVHLEDVTREKMAELKLREEYGAVVIQVEDDSPAAKAGLRPNDVILEYQGERVNSVAELARLVRETPAGRTVQLVISRDGQRQTLSTTLEPRQHLRREIRLPRIRIPDINIEVFSRPRLGISADGLTPQLAEYFGVKQGKGVLVREVTSGSAAEKAGLKAGDVIVRVDNEAVEDVATLRRALGKKKGGESVTLSIVRNRQESSLTVELEQARGSGDTAYLLEREELDEWRDAMKEMQGEMREFQRQWQQQEQEIRKQVDTERRHLEQELIRLRLDRDRKVTL